jgi:hypothetical protein
MLVASDFQALKTYKQGMQDALNCTETKLRIQRQKREEGGLFGHNKEKDPLTTENLAFAWGVDRKTLGRLYLKLYMPEKYAQHEARESAKKEETKRKRALENGQAVREKDEEIENGPCVMTNSTKKPTLQSSVE